MIDRILSNIMRKQEQDRTLEIGLTPIVAPFLELPGLIGFWPMSSVDLSSGDAYDISGQARRMTYTGNPTYNVHNGVTPYIDFDGTGDYLLLLDASDLDIIGNEAIYASTVRGFTMGGWFWADALAAISGLMTKDNAGAQRSYSLYADPTNARLVGLANGASTNTVVLNGVFTTLNAWHYCVVRWIPSTSLSVWSNLDGVLTSNTNTTSIVATLTNSTADFLIGGFSGAALLLNGRASMCFLSANALSDALITSLFNETRGYFGV